MRDEQISFYGKIKNLVIEPGSLTFHSCELLGLNLVLPLAYRLILCNNK